MSTCKMNPACLCDVLSYVFELPGVRDGPTSLAASGMMKREGGFSLTRQRCVWGGGDHLMRIESGGMSNCFRDRTTMTRSFIVVVATGWGVILVLRRFP